MKIKVDKKDNGEIVFYIDDEEHKFEYEEFDKLIDSVYDNDSEIEYESLNELKEYEKLLKGIIDGARTDDFREAVKKAKEANKKIKEEERIASNS